MTRSGAGLSATTPCVREALPRRVPKRPVLAHHPAQTRASAGRSPGSTRPLSPGSATPTSTDCLQTRGSSGTAARLSPPSPTLRLRSGSSPNTSRWQPSCGNTNRGRAGRPAAGARCHIHTGVDGALGGAAETRLPLRRADNRLCRDAIARRRQRPPRRLRVPPVAEAERAQFFRCRKATSLPRSVLQPAHLPQACAPPRSSG